MYAPCMRLTTRIQGFSDACSPDGAMVPAVGGGQDGRTSSIYAAYMRPARRIQVAMKSSRLVPVLHTPFCYYRCMRSSTSLR